VGQAATKTLVVALIIAPVRAVVSTPNLASRTHLVIIVAWKKIVSLSIRKCAAAWVENVADRGVALEKNARQKIHRQLVMNAKLNAVAVIRKINPAELAMEDVEFTQVAKLLNRAN
jgi:hypothetical protein